jgi:predicted site-specific integrase-resolvase
MRIYIFFILFILFKIKKMDNENYISPSKITKQYDITSGTLRRWSEAGKIRCLRPNGGKRIYNIQDIKKIFNADNSQDVDNSKNKFTKLLEDFKNNLNLENNPDLNKDDVYKSIKVIEDECNILSNLYQNK